MQPKEKLFREIIKLDKEIKEHKARIKVLEARAVKLGWASISPEYDALVAPDKNYWETKAPDLFQEMLKHYNTVTKKGRFTDGGYKNKLAKAIAAEIA